MNDEEERVNLLDKTSVNVIEKRRCDRYLLAFIILVAFFLTTIGILASNQTNRVQNVVDIFDIDIMGVNSSDFLHIIDIEKIDVNNSDFLPPIWSCSKETEHTNKKLVFVHVYKTAGSTMRQLLFDYGKVCRHPLTEIVSCATLMHKSINQSLTDDNAVWQDRKSGHPCINKHTTDITEQRVIQKRDMKSSDLTKYKVDILAGHVSIGVDNYWYADIGRTQPVDVQYITFVREPIHRYVSFLLYFNKKEEWNIDEAYEFIHNRVMTESEASHHFNVYSSYLVTPLQKEVSMTESEKVEVIKQNLMTHNVIVGVTKKMSSTISLLQSVIDPNLKCTSLFLARLKKVANKSAISTTALVELLSKDQDWLNKAREFLKYEYEVYEFAVKIHENQFKAMVQKYGQRFNNF